MQIQQLSLDKVWKRKYQSSFWNKDIDSCCKPTKPCPLFDSCCSFLKTQGKQLSLTPCLINIKKINRDQEAQYVFWIWFVWKRNRTNCFLSRIKVYHSWRLFFQNRTFQEVLRYCNNWSYFVINKTYFCRISYLMESSMKENNCFWESKVRGKAFTLNINGRNIADCIKEKFIGIDSSLKDAQNFP